MHYELCIALRQNRASATGLQLFEEVVALVVNEDECGEVLHLNLPNRLHTKFGIFHALDGLDVVLGEDGSGAADGTEVEAAVLFASVCYGFGAVALGEHNH